MLEGAYSCFEVRYLAVKTRTESTDVRATNGQKPSTKIIYIAT